MKVLAHGTKFTPVTKGDYFDAKKCTEEFTRKLKLKHLYRDSNYNDDSLCRLKSKNQVTVKDEEMKRIVREIENTEPVKCETENNLSTEERAALKELQQDERIIIKEADKGGALVIMDRSFYKDKLIMEDHLNDGSTYRKVESNADTKTFKNLNKLIEKHDECLTKKEKEYVTDNDWVTSEFYVRPKIHKCKSIIEEVQRNPREIVELNGAPDLVGRPIVAGVNAPTRHLSDLIGKILSPLVLEQVTYIKDDWDYIRKLPGSVNFKCNLFGCDIKSLYTSIPHDLGLQAITYWLNRCRHLIPNRFTNTFILESIEFLLKNNNFNFNGFTFNQLSGTAMGSSFASFYACLTIGYLEETILFPAIDAKYDEHIAKIIKETYKRFMDDGIVFLPIEVSKTEFLELLNAMHPSITFTLEDSETIRMNNKEVQKLNFLDILVMLLENGTIELDIYYKITNTHDYVHYDSFHTQHVLDNVPYNLAKRIIVFVSNDDVMEKRLQELKQYLLKCEYPENIIDKGIHNARLQGPANKKSNDDVTTYIHTNMANFDFRPIINKARNLLQQTNSEEIRNLFKNVRIIEGIKQPKNILKSITSTRFCETNETPNRPLPGIYAECRETSGCELCSFGYMQNCDSFTTSNGTQWEIKSHINCNSKNVLYFVTCTKCQGEMKVTKTGKTFTTLRARMNNHRSNCRTGRTSDVFDKHVHECMKKNNSFDEPFFEIRAFMKLSTHDKLYTYERELHKRKYATINT